jgi:hypothetical protein
MSAEIAVYLRADQVIVVPQGGGGGHSWDAAPPLVVEPEVAALAPALVEALAVSRDIRADGTEPPHDLRPSRSPVLRALGIGSYKEFFRGASHCSLYEEVAGGELLMFKSVPAKDRSGFDGAPDYIETITDPSQAADIVLNYLCSAPAMPG